jgi:hypothetical protein
MIYLMIAIIIGLTSQDPPRQETFEGFISGIRANAVKGEVFYQRGDGKFNLEAGHKLEEGDFIKTGPDSYAELLLQPGNYLRIGADTECQIFSDPRDKMRFKLNRGAISVEILSKESEGSFLYYESLSQVYDLIRIITPNAEVFITRSGIFRVNSIDARRTDVIVRDGEAVINGQRVKEKRSGLASDQGVTIAEINSKLEDGFDTWSRARAAELVEANRLLKRESPWARELKEDEEAAVDLPEDGSQTRSQRLVISAKPGTVNFVEAGVELKRPTKDWELLTEKSQLEAGDKLRTTAHTFAELSMLPDINLRVDSRSEVLFEQLSNERISVKLLEGSAILDVARFESAEREERPQIALAGTSTSVLIADEGIYRINIKSNGDEITIRHGKVMFKERMVSSCRQISAGTVSDCYKKASDNFDVWSDHRGEGKLYSGRDVIAMGAYLDRARRARFKNTGFWLQNPGKTSYTFVPFSSQRFRSPYGGNYSTVLSPRRVPMIRPDSRQTPPFGRMPQIARPQP